MDGKNITVDGRNTTEGRVEVCVNNAWGTICDNVFSADDAEVICHQLQFDRKGNILFLYAVAGRYQYTSLVYFFTNDHETKIST